MCSPKGIEAFSADFQAEEDVSLIKIAKDAQWHESKRRPVKNELSHPAEGEAWKQFNKSWPTFAKDVRNLKL
jgi:hypothetical protein